MPWSALGGRNQLRRLARRVDRAARMPRTRRMSCRRDYVSQRYDPEPGTTRADGSSPTLCQGPSSPRPNSGARTMPSPTVQTTAAAPQPPYLYVLPALWTIPSIAEP